MDNVPRRKLPHAVIVKAPGLLNMAYKLSELADEISVPESTLRDWLDAGAPHNRDARNHIWINGKDFAAWVFDQRKKPKTGSKLADNEAYCLSCKKAVILHEPHVQQMKGKLIMIKGTCPLCKKRINRGGRSE